MTEDVVLAFACRSRKMLTVLRHGFDTDDLVQEMVCYFLSCADPQMSLVRAYWEARDRLDKRVRTPSGRQRTSALVKHDAQAWAWKKAPDCRGWHDALLAFSALPSRRRAVLVLYALYGFAQPQLASMLGITQGRVSQILSGWESTHG